MQVNKPDSVTRQAELLSFIYSFCHQKDLASHPPRLGEQPSSLGLFGFSTHKVYPANLIT